MGNLTANEIKSFLAKGSGTYQDGDGLLLRVTGVGVGQWKLRIQHEGKRRDIGLGSAKLVSLASARAKAAEARKAIREDGRDLLAEKREAKAAAVTFREAALALHEARQHQWANGKHSGQWIATLETYAFPLLGTKPVGNVSAGDIIAAIAGVWTAKPETGRRVRQRICAVLDYAHARGWRSTEAPARSLAAGKGLPKQPHGRNHTAMPYDELPMFLTRLRASGGVWGRLALEFTILTAARSQEVRLAKWDEFDTKNAVWTVPAAHMKMKREHVVPLSPQALAVLKSAMAVRLDGTDLVFPGTNGPMSDMTLLAVLRRMKEPVTVHGFRSTFRTWVAEKTDFPGEVAEAALAHQNPNEVERAYQRGAMLEKRRKLMEAWGAYCEAGSEKVRPNKQRRGEPVSA
ncbi:tyrosine-type recombinase/integrase [Sphingomonas sp. ID1715]|uniref:tyrosine-type recombinase/integrase n=1 Tax=Sphingomonas sp. ID1715 TaxID=1656898 RepID=UPI0014883A25|nr:site-specific integrase [Sphingomonas sp. ID1715]NNM76338.1 tyrosine-type recombinase/integrase [Sphingomonas sp. ID1715]